MICEERWTGLYSGNFDLLTPESMAHPAKASPALMFKIIEHLEELGLLKPGATILDCLGGVGTTAICSTARGYRAITVELENRFIDYCRTYLCPGVVHYTVTETTLPAREAGWVDVESMVDGDPFELKVTSRYWAKAVPERRRYKASGNCRCGKGEWHPVHRVIGNKDYAARRLGRPLQWEIIQGDSRKLSQLLTERGLVSILSPPYAQAQSGGGISAAMRGEGNYKVSTVMPGNVYQPAEHSVDPSNIGNLPDKPLTIMSPPYDGEPGHKGNDLSGIRADTKWLPEYGNSEGQIGSEKSESYLQAMALIYQQIALVSDVCVTITKNPTRGGKLRLLDEDTARLLEAAGFTIVCHHRALLFTEESRQDLFGQTHKKVKGRMSFFKRLSYQKGNAVAQWEDVLVAVKNGGGELITISSPPYSDNDGKSLTKRNRQVVANSWAVPDEARRNEGYGQTPGQIGNLKDGKR